VDYHCSTFLVLPPNALKCIQITRKSDCGKSYLPKLAILHRSIHIGVSNNSGIGILKGETAETFQVSKDRWDPSRWFWQDACQTSKGKLGFQSIGGSEFLKAERSYMDKSQCAIAWLNQSHPSVVARGERSCRVGDRGYESPMHLIVGIAISRYPISWRCYES